MVVDEIVGELVGRAFGAVGEIVVEFTFDFIFSSYGARYFHGIGRRVLMVATLGLVRIPSSLREIPVGEKAKPKGSDWFALVTGIVTVVSAAAFAIWALINL